MRQWIVADNLSGMTQKSFADLSWEQKDKKTRRERFLGEMELVVPWKELVNQAISAPARNGETSREVDTTSNSAVC